jgi:hypothetical protein
MKFLYAITIFAFTLLPLGSSLFAQCADCTPDETCVSSDGFPALCPLVPDDATAGVYYEEQLTFFMPALINDPGTGIEATLLSVTIASVSGLPYGLEFTINDEDGVFYPSAGDGLGCATICGVPLLPGTYSVVITVNAVVSVFGFEASQSQSFTLTLNVVPGEGSANSFSYNNIAGCGSVDVTYEALLSVPAPSVTTYSWDFGNGQLGTDATPSVVSYNAPGDYTAILTTTVSDYKLNTVSVNSLNDNWGGDLDDLISQADVYFILYDANGSAVFTSSANDNITATSWDVPAITLTTPPYTIQFFDEDDITADDNLGSYEFSLLAGENFFDIENGTTGFIDLTLDPTTQITDSATISVFPLPAPSIELTGNTLELTAADAAVITWFRNGLAIDGALAATLEIEDGGLYYAEVVNSFGCVALSNEVLYCAPLQIEFDATAGELSVNDVYESYQWYFNGLSVDGGSNSYIPSMGNGNYMVEVTTEYGCTTESDVFILNLSVENLKNPAFAAYPNPASDQIFFESPAITGESQIAVHDILGGSLPVISLVRSTGLISIDVNSYAPGIYFTTIDNHQIRWVKK